MEKSKEIKYLGGVVKFIPAGSFVDEQTKQEKSYDARVKVYEGSRDPVVLSLDAARALVEAARTDSDISAFLG